MKFLKRKLINLQTTEKKHKTAQDFAKAHGMTLTGLIRVALKKMFDIDL